MCPSSELQKLDPALDFAPEILRSILRVQLDIAVAGLGISEVMQKIADSALTVVLSGQGAVVELLEGTEMVYRAASGSASSFLGLRLKAESSLSGLSVKSGEILICHDARTDHRVDRAACEKIDVLSMILVPLRYKSRSVGVLKLVASHPNAFTESDKKILSVLAVTLSAALANSEEYTKHDQELTNALKSSELRYRTLTESLPQLIWTCLPDGTCDFLSKQWIEYTGIPEQEQLGDRWLDLTIHPDDKARTYEHWMGAVHAKHSYDIEYRIRRHDGAYRWFKTRGVPILDGQGKIQHWFGSCTDIHDQIMAEERLQESLRIRDEFLSIASHELKTPLTTLKLHTQTLERDIKNGNPRAYAVDRINRLSAQAEKQVSRLIRLVEDMLDIARIRTGRLTIKKETFDLCELIQEVLERLQPQFVQSAVPLPRVHCNTAVIGNWDRLRMDQVLTNLLTNAIRYGEKRPVSIEVVPTNRFVQINVRDQGIGIAPQDCERIFDPFERAVDASDVSGLGLGLYISKQIIQSHGGTLSLETQVGKGSVFTIQLPSDTSH